MWNTVLSSVISCGDPGPVANGIYVGNDFTYNHTIVYHCNPGHLMEPAGQGTLRCTKEGAWNQTKPSCKGKSSQSRAGLIEASFSLRLWLKHWFGASSAPANGVLATNPHIHLIKNAFSDRNRIFTQYISDTTSSLLRCVGTLQRPPSLSL